MDKNIGSVGPTWSSCGTLCPHPKNVPPALFCQQQQQQQQQATMALQMQNGSFLSNPLSPPSSSSPRYITTNFGRARPNPNVGINSKLPPSPWRGSGNNTIRSKIDNGGWRNKRVSPSASGGGSGSAMPNSNYVVPLDNSSVITRPLNEILRDLNKRVPDNIIDIKTNCIPWLVHQPTTFLLKITSFLLSSLSLLVFFIVCPGITPIDCWAFTPQVRFTSSSFTCYLI